MLVREMTLGDIHQAAVIEKECFSMPWSESSFRDSITREDTIFLVCEDDSVITGYIGMYISFEEGSITNVAVHPSHRKKGYGNTLVSVAKEKAKERQVERIFLEVRVSNMAAIALYQKMGFENLGIRKNFYDHPKEDAYIMACEMSFRKK